MRTTEMFLWAFFLVEWSSPASAQVHATRPEIDGRPVWDGPLRDAPEEVERAWQQYQAALRTQPGRPPRNSLNAVNRWASQRFTTFMERRTDDLHRLEESVRPLAQEGTLGERLFASLVVVTLQHDFVRILDNLPVPNEIAQDAELRATYEHAIADRTEPFLMRAAETYRFCAQTASQLTGSLGEWAPVCAARATELQSRAEEIQARRERQRHERERMEQVYGGAAVPVACTAGVPAPAPERSSPEDSDANFSMVGVFRPDDPDDWLEGSSGPSAGLRSLDTYWAVASIVDDDPRLQIAETLEGQARAALRQCFHGHGVAAFAIRFTVGPSGDTRDVATSPLRGALNGEADAVELVRSCVGRAIERVSWAATAAPTPVNVEATICTGRGY